MTTLPRSRCRCDRRRRSSGRRRRGWPGCGQARSLDRARYAADAGRHDRPWSRLARVGGGRSGVVDDREPDEAVQGHVPFVDGAQDLGAVAGRERSLERNGTISSRSRPGDDWCSAGRYCAGWPGCDRIVGQAGHEVAGFDAPGSRDSKSDETNIFEHMPELHACAEVQPRRWTAGGRRKFSADHCRPCPQARAAARPAQTSNGILSRHRCGWQRRFDHQYDGYNFVPSKEPVCSERLNEGSFA